jgi:hypothetical protein
MILKSFKFECILKFIFPQRLEFNYYCGIGDFGRIEKLSMDDLSRPDIKFKRALPKNIHLFKFFFERNCNLKIVCLFIFDIYRTKTRLRLKFTIENKS